MNARLTVIEHEAEAGLGYFAGWLPGVEIDVVRPYLGDPVPEAAADGLLVLGGAASAWDDENYAWLPATRDLMRRAVEDGVPTLGICLGAQLLTMACGGTVVRGEAGLEIGAPPVELLPEAAGDALLGAVPVAGPRAVQYHFDAMTVLPEGAVRLASSVQYPNQAYRLGDSAWAVQFHPEATPEIFTEWTEGLTDRSAGELNQQVTDAAPELEKAWRPFAEAFAARVRAQTA